MKIVHLIDYFQPLLGYQETFLAREQLRLGHAVTVVTSDRYAPFPDYERTIKPVLGERFQPTGQRIEEGIPVWRLPVRFEGGFRCWLGNLKQALTVLRPDIVHAHGVVKLSTLQAALLKPRLEYRLLVDDHMHRVNVKESGRGSLFYQAFQRLIAPFLCRRIDALAAITDETALIVRDVYGIATPPVQVIELGVDIHLFQFDPKLGQVMRVKLGVASGDFLVIYTGKIIPEKAPHWLLEALPLCPPQIKVLMVGNIAVGYQKQIERVIAEHGLNDRIIFQDAVKQTELPGYYSAADAGCWPRETSMAMLEAASCGLPIVIAKGELAQRVRYGNGLEYQEGDVSDLARCLTRLFENQDQTQRMGEQGRKLVEDHYSWQEINRQFLAAYQGERKVA